MFIRVIGSSAPNGSSIRMIRGPQDQRPGDRHALPHAAGELVRILVLVLGDVQADVADPLAAQLVALLAAERPGTPGRR